MSDAAPGHVDGVVGDSADPAADGTSADGVAPTHRRGRVTPLAWLVPVGFVVSVVSLFLPWFEPGATGRGHRITLATLHAWEDGTIFVVAPIALLLASGVTVSLLLDRPFGRFRGMAEPARPAGWFVVAAGALCAICVGVEWLLVPAQFPMWNSAAAIYARAGLTLGKDPQLGYLLNLVGVVLALAGGAVMIILSRPDAAER